jgi:hypothetical protein
MSNYQSIPFLFYILVGASHKTNKELRVLVLDVF